MLFCDPPTMPARFTPRRDDRYILPSVLFVQTRGATRACHYPRRRSAMHLDSWKAAKRLSRTGMTDGGSHRRQIPDERDRSGPGRVKWRPGGLRCHPAQADAIQYPGGPTELTEL